MKYTPGPWEASNGNIWTEGEQVFVAMTNGVPIGDSLKNAELIAAAPEMYEALRNLENDNGAIPDHAWQMVQNAINKAEGKNDSQT